MLATGTEHTMHRIVFTSLFTIASLSSVAAAQEGWTYYQCEVEQTALSRYDDSVNTGRYSLFVRHNAQEIDTFTETGWGGGWTSWCNSERDSCYVSRQYLFRQRDARESPDIQFEIDYQLLNRITGEYIARVANGYLDSRGEQRINVINRRGVCVQLDGSPFEFD